MDENFVAKLLDVGSEVEFDDGTVIHEPGDAASGLLLLLHGTVAVEESDGATTEHGPGNVVDLAALEDALVIATSEVRAVAVDRAAYEAALSG